MNKKIKLFKKISLSSFLAFIPLVAASCTTVPSVNLVNNSILVHNSNNVSDFLTLKPIAKSALKTNSGIRNYATDLTNKFLLDWLNKAAELNPTFKTRLDLQKANIDEKINKEKEEKKQAEGNNFSLKWQQDVLDLHGGSEESYKNEELASYARSEFTNNVLTNLFLSVYDSQNNRPILNPSADQILNGLYGYLGMKKDNSTETHTTFAIDPRIVLTSNETTDLMYANFQRFLIKNYFDYEAPFIYNQVGWNYATNARNELEKIYNNNLLTTSSASTENNNENTNMALSNGTYEFPYFSSSNNTNNNTSTVERFKNFVEEAKKNKNLLDSNKHAKDLGIKKIDQRFSELTSTLAFGKTSNLFSANTPNIANALAYLFGSKQMSMAPGVAGVPGVAAQTAASKMASDETLINNIDASLTKMINTSNTGDLKELDPITANFVSCSDPISRNGKENPRLKLPKEYSAKIFNPNSKLKEKELYVLDNFIPNTNSSKAKRNRRDGRTSEADMNGLSQFMFIRDNAGVKALSIEGSDVIKKETTLSKRREKAFGYVLYYHFLNQLNANTSGLNIDLRTELTSFLTSNLEWLILSYVTNENKEVDFLKSQNNKLATELVWFNTNNLTANEKTLVNKTSNYLKNLAFYNTANAANTANLNNKKTFATRYFNEAAKNGLASNFNYQKLSANHPYAYMHLKVLNTAINPFLKQNGSENGTNSNKTIHEELYEAIDTYIDSEEISPLNLSNEFYQYSQRLNTNNASVNKAIDSFLSDAQLVKNYVTYHVIEPIIKNEFDFSDLSFKSLKPEGSNEIKDYLNQAFYNWYLYDKLNINSNLYNFDLSLTTFPKLDKLDELVKYSKEQLKVQNSFDYANQINNYADISKIALLSINQTKNNLTELLDYLKTTIGNEKAYFVWNINIDGNITNTASKINSSSSSSASAATLGTQAPPAAVPPSAAASEETNFKVDIAKRDQLLQANKDKIQFSINNNNFSYYYGNYVEMDQKTIKLDANNLAKDQIYTNNDLAKFYKYISYGMQPSGQTQNGNPLDNYLGLLYQNQTTGLDQNANEILFNNNSYRTVLFGKDTSRLFEYESKANLEKLIDEANNITDLNSLANAIDQKTNNTYLIALQLNQISSNNPLDTVKNKFKELAKTINDNEFKPIVGYLKDSTNSVSSSDFKDAYRLNKASNDINSTFVISIKPSDLNNLDALKKALSTAKVKDTNMNLDVNQLTYNLVVQFAKDEKFINTLLASLIANNRIVTNDQRIYSSFNAEEGRVFISNYRLINNASGSISTVDTNQNQENDSDSNGNNTSSSTAS